MSNQMSMLRLCTLDPSKYGWTAIGGISTNLLVPHEMARRPEARDKFLKQRDSTTTSSDSKNGIGGGNVDAPSSKYYSIKDPSSLTLSSSSSSSNRALNAAAASVGTTTEVAAVPDDANDDTNKSTTNKALKEIVIHATTTKTDATTTNAKANDDYDDPHSSSLAKLSPPISKSDAPAPPSTSKPSSPTTFTTATTAASSNTTNLDIYTYHRGRVGQEPRDPITGALLCDMDPIDTNHGWVPGKSTVCKVTINFPLGDVNDDEDDDDEDLVGKNGGCDSGGEELSTMLDSRRRGGNVGGMPESHVRPSRTSRSSVGGNSGGGSAGIAATAVSSANAATINHPQVPHFVQVIDWDLANPHTPTPELYATSIASEFGLSFPQTMDLIESIERQLHAFCSSQPMFYAPMAILDPYGCERPDAHFGPPEIHCGPVLSSATAAGGAAAGSSRSYVIRRMNSNQSNGRGGGGGGSSSNSRRSGGTSSSRPPGAVKPDKRGIQVVPKDQLVLPNKEGDVHVAEVLRRAKSRSMAMVVECGKRGEETLTTTKNEVCHICHNRKECGLTFHCGVHNYCDFHCATRLGFRVSDYDRSQPLNLPVNFCPVCTLICLCAKCTRRLDEVSKLLKKESQKQNVDPKDTIMENVFELCSFKLKYDVNVTTKPPSTSDSSTQRSSKDKAPSKKVKIEQSNENKGAGKKVKRRYSSGSVTNDDNYDDDAKEGPRKISSRSMRSSPSSDAVLDERPSKKRKFEKTSAFVSVLKVPPSAFPKEMCHGEDLDPSTPEDMNKEFVPDGAIPVIEPAMPILGCSQKYQDLIPPYVAESHFYPCAECDQSGSEFIVCKDCPRVYHEKCYAKYNSSPIAIDDNGDSEVTTVSSGVPVIRHLSSPCHRCEIDRRATDLEVDENPDKKTSESQNVTNIGMILCKVQQILNFLIKYDFGFIFAIPVDTKLITDYRQVITKPMDYGTIVSNLEKGQYDTSDGDLSKRCSGVESLNNMEKILLQAVMDIMQVHHNCSLYNPEGSSFYRAGKVQERKWVALFNELKRGNFPELVSLQLIRFREECEKERKSTRRTRHFEAKNPENKECKPIAVFDPDTKRIVKQYSSKASAKSAAILLSKMGYACESELTSTNAMIRLDNAKDPMKPLFGYQWLPTEELKSGLFKIKPYFRNDDLVSPTPSNIVVLKSDTIIGVDQPQRGFPSEDAAYGDWLNEKSKSFTSSSNAVDEQDGCEASRTDFVQNYLDGNRSINGIVWNRVDNQGNTITPKLAPHSTGKVVMEEEHAPMSPMKKMNEN